MYIIQRINYAVAFKILLGSSDVIDSRVKGVHANLSKHEEDVPFASVVEICENSNLAPDPSSNTCKWVGCCYHQAILS